MRPGKVVSVRVNPKDCMGVIDVIDTAGLNVAGMSFPAMVSLALGSLLQTMRDQEVIPDRSGFEYSEMMAPYLGQRTNRRKLEITDTIHKAGSGIKVHGLSKPAKDLDGLKVEGTLSMPQPTVEVPVTKPSGEAMRDRRRLTELLQKKDLADNGEVVWQAEDEKEYKELYQKVYPEG